MMVNTIAISTTVQITRWASTSGAPAGASRLKKAGNTPHRL
jgi:hypothetical protein